jgi:hypothetical protein
VRLLQVEVADHVVGNVATGSQDLHAHQRARSRLDMELAVAHSQSATVIDRVPEVPVPGRCPAERSRPIRKQGDASTALASPGRRGGETGERQKEQSRPRRQPEPPRLKIRLPGKNLETLWEEHDYTDSGTR